MVPIHWRLYHGEILDTENGFPEPRKFTRALSHLCVRRLRETQAEVSGSPEGHAVGHSCLYTTHTGACLVRFSTLFALAW